MVDVVAIHSFRGGTGKSTVSSNLAVALADKGKRVLILDMDIKSPGIHAIFGFDEGSFEETLNDYILGQCKVEDIVYDISDELEIKEEGELFFVPSSIAFGDIATLLTTKKAIRKIERAIKELIEWYDLDYVVVDTHPGINEEALVASELSNISFVIVRPDNQDYQGLKVMLDVGSKIDENIHIVLNKISPKQEPKKVAAKITKLFKVPVAAALPFSQDILFSESRHVFYRTKPHHAFSKEINKLRKTVLERTENEEK